MSDEEKPFLYKVMEKRINFCFTYTFTERVLAFLSIKCKSVGTAIMYLWYFQYLSKKHNLNKFDISDVSEYFPNGFPSEDDLSGLWDEQKVKRPVNSLSSDNLLDYSSAGESILNLN